MSNNSTEIDPCRFILGRTVPSIGATVRQLRKSRSLSETSISQEFAKKPWASSKTVIGPRPQGHFMFGGV
jgi:hypothetical protein